MSKLPAFQFYPGDWRKDPGVQSLDFEARGVWFEILCLMHESDRRGVLLLNGAAMPDAALARLLGIDLDLLNQITTKLLTFGVASREPSTGALMSRRMVRDEEIRKVRKECGKLGGNPRLLNQITTSPDNQIPTPSSSSSSSSSISSSEENTPTAPRGASDEAKAKAREIEEQANAIYEAYPRKTAKPAALKAIRKALAKHTFDFLISCANRYSIARAGQDPTYTPYPATWFNREQFKDDPATWGILAAQPAATNFENF